MRKLTMLMALLAVMALAAVPVLAQPVQEFELEEAESGDAEPAFEVANSGNSSSMCVGGLQQTNTGNVQNIQGVNQDRVVESDDLEFEGSTITIGPEAELACEQSIMQSAAAS